MTDEEIDKLTNDELSVAVAAHVFGWVWNDAWKCLAPPNYPTPEVLRRNWTYDSDGSVTIPHERIAGTEGVSMAMDGTPKVPRFATSIAAAWEAAKHTVATVRNPHAGGMTSFAIHLNPYTNTWVAKFDWSNGDRVEAWHALESTAIARAALKAHYRKAGT
ncbi:MAG TPA: hypothetical protein VGN72_01260 [Tepidisphaeraceae bacterium]|jgi:hypothetical protein|nr:hypothetical protein [Tepidisphaeraceae bacterium]